MEYINQNWVSEWVSEWSIAIRLPTKLMDVLLIHEQKRKKHRRISLLDNYYYSSPSSVANQNGGFALVH